MLLAKEQQQEAKLHFADYWQVIKTRYWVILLTFLLVVLTALLITYLTPPKYRSVAKIQIFKLQQDFDLFNNGQNAGSELIDSNFMTNQFNIITSKVSLLKVIERMELVDRWQTGSADAAYGRLRGSIETNNQRGSDFIEIVVYDEDRQLAAQIAKEVAEAYAARRRQIEVTRETKALEALKEEVKKQESEKDVALANVHQIMKAQGIVPQHWSYSQNTGISDAGGISDLYNEKRKRLEVQKEEIAKAKSQLNNLSSVNGDDMIRAARQLKLDDAAIATIYPRYLDDLNTLEKLEKSGYGKSHPKIQQIQASLKKNYELLSDGVESIKKTLRTQLKSYESTRKTLQEDVNKMQESSIEASTQGIGYDTAKNKFIQEQRLFDTLSETLALQEAEKKMTRTPMEWQEFPVVANHYAKPNVSLNMTIGIIGGLLLGLGLAFFLDYMDTTVKSMDDIERYLQLPVLAVIPKDIKMLHTTSGAIADAEAYRILRTNIEFNRSGNHQNSLTCVSGGAGEGKSTTLINLAFVCAQGGYKTVLVDADLRRPKLHTLFNEKNDIGLTNYLTEEHALEDVIKTTNVENLFLMTSGAMPVDPSGLLNSQEMTDFLAEAKSEFDMVFVDSPPILGVSDASVLVNEMDITIIVIQQGKLPRNMLAKVKEAINRAGGNLLGVVMNNVDIRSDSQYHYYTSYYTYYTPDNKIKRKKSSVKEKAGSKHAEKVVHVAHDEIEDEQEY